MLTLTALGNSVKAMRLRRPHSDACVSRTEEWFETC
jgi:hypothetical protein